MTEAGFGMLAAINTVIIIFLEVPKRSHGQLVSSPLNCTWGTSDWNRFRRAGVWSPRSLAGGYDSDLDVWRDDPAAGEFCLCF